MVTFRHCSRQFAERTEASEAAQGPDGENIAVAGIADGTGLVEHTADVFLRPVSIVKLAIHQNPHPFL